MRAALGAVPLAHDDRSQAPVVHRADPASGRIGEGPRARQNLSRDPTHGAGRGGVVLDRPSADQLTHRQIAAEPVGIIAARSAACADHRADPPPYRSDQARCPVHDTAADRGPAPASRRCSRPCKMIGTAKLPLHGASISSGRRAAPFAACRSHPHAWERCRPRRDRYWNRPSTPPSQARPRWSARAPLRRALSNRPAQCRAPEGRIRPPAA